jgi:hypothetical protein
MSIDVFKCVDRQNDHHRCRPIGPSWRTPEGYDEAVSLWNNDNTIYTMEAGIEYLYSYQDPVQAVSDFEKWRRMPLEDIRLTLNGVVQPGARLPIDADVMAAVELASRRADESYVIAAVEEAE